MKVFRAIAVFCGVCVVLATGLIAITPSLLSTSWGKELGVSLANHAIPGSLHIDSLSCGWLSGIDVQGCTVHDQDGKQLLSLKRFILQKPLVSLLISQKDFGEISVQSPTIFIYETPPHEQKNHQEKPHKEKATLDVDKTASPSFQNTSIPDVQGHIMVTDAKVIALKNSTVVGQIAGSEIDVDLNLQHNTTGSIKASLIDKNNASTPVQMAFSLQGNPRLLNIKGNVHFSCDQVNTESLALFAAAIDPRFPSIIKECFGSSLSYDVKAVVDDGKFSCQSLLESQNLKSSLSFHLSENQCTIDKGQLLQGTITPSLVQTLSNEVTLEKPVLCSLDTTQPITVDLSSYKLSPFLLRFSPSEPFPFVVNGKNLLLQLGLEAKNEGDATSMSFVVSSLLDPASLRFTASMNEKDFRVTSVTSLSGSWPRLVDSMLHTSLVSVIGPTCDSTMTATTQYRDGTLPYQITASVEPNTSTKSVLSTFLQQKPLQLSLDGSVDAKKVFLSKLNVTSIPLTAQLQEIECSWKPDLSISIGQPGSFSCTVPQEMLSLPLTSPLKLDGTINPTNLSSKKGILHVNLSSQNISLPNSKPYSLVAPVTFDVASSKGTVDLNLSSPEASIVKAHVTATLPNKIVGTIDLQQVPIALLESATHKPLVQAIGDKATGLFNFNFEGFSSRNNTLIGTVQGPFWNASIDLLLNKTLLTSQNKEAVKLDTCISKETLGALKQIAGVSSSITVVDPVYLHVVVPKPSIDLSSFFEEAPFSPWKLLDETDLEAKISLSPMAITQDNFLLGKFAPLTSSFALKGKSREIEYSLLAKQRNEEEVNLDISGSVKNAWATALTLEKSSIAATIDIDRLPVRLVELALPKKGELLEQAIGKTVRVTGICSLEKMKSGVVKLDVRAQHAFLHLDGTINDGVLSLQNPATANLEVTKEAGSLLLKDINPLLSTTVHAEKPISITIDPKGTSIPIAPFAVSSLSLPHVTIDAGKILVKNTGTLKVILALLRLGKAANSEEINVWLTPMYVSVNHGLIKCMRADALVAEDLHIITWGDMDLKNDIIDMVVAIPQESLQHVGIQIVSTHPERGLQIPIKGSSSNPKVDTTKAAAKIAGAGMMSSSKDSRVQLLGGLIQAASSINDTDQPIPAPTTQPFPWERSRR